MAAHLQAVMVQKIDRTLVQITTENLTALVAADFSGGRNFVEIDGLAVVALNIRHHITLYEKIRLLRFCGRLIWHHRMAAQKTAP